MDIVKEIEACTKQLIHNEIRESQLNDRLIQPMTSDEWKKFLPERSAAIRAFYPENEECFQKLKAYSTGPLNQEIADALFESARAMLLQGRMDPAILVEIANPVVEYYVRENQTEKAVILSIIRNTTMQDYYGRMLRGHKQDFAINSYTWVLSQRDRYTTFQDIRTRRNIFHAFSGLAMTLAFLPTESNLMTALDYVDTANALWQKPEVQALDGNDPNISYAVQNLDFWDALELDFVNKSSSAVTERIIGILQDYLETDYLKDDPNADTIRTIINLRLQEHRHIISSDEATARLYHMVETMPTPNWAGDTANAQMLFQLYSLEYFAAMNSLTRSSLPIEEREKWVHKFLSHLQRMIDGLPYEHLAYYVDDVCQNYLKTSLPHVADADFKEKLLYDLTIHRQPSTYIHCQMVEQIALTIAETIIDKEPELFLSLPEYDTVEQILAHKTELLNIIGRSARLHDAGKCNIASVIMQQSRKLTDEEFLCIKSHPDLGVTYFENDPNFTIYNDIIRGHHKTYDGKGGYPYDFDNTASPYRILIDLISISDSTDAATDTLGRNYAAGKNFKRLLGELQEGAGTRYNPDIVRVISESPETIEKLNELTAFKRIEYCYDAYQNMLKNYA